VAELSAALKVVALQRLASAHVPIIFRLDAVGMLYHAMSNISC